MRGGEKFAWPLSAVSLVFAALALPVTYVAVPFCRPGATIVDLGATVGIVSVAAALALAAILASLLSVYTIGSNRARTSLVLSGVSMAIATAFIVFGLALRTCPT